MKSLYGTGVAMVTPFDASGAVDYQAIDRLVPFITRHADYLVVNGTTAESPTLDHEEKKQILKRVLAANRYQKPIVFGIGGNDTRAILQSVDETDFTGITAILSVSPNYNKPSQEGIARHYELIADRCPVPVILYNVPLRTASNMEASTTIRLSAHPNIIGIKEASGNLQQCLRIVKGCRPDFMLISGDDLMTLPLLSIGGVGVISVIANALPQLYSQMVRDALANQRQQAYETLHLIGRMNELIFEEGNPSGVKGLLELLGVCSRGVRLPLVEATNGLMQKIETELAEIKKVATL